MKRVTFEYDIGETVSIAKVDGIDGYVSGMSTNINGLMYRVIWWQDGRRIDEWLFGWEIKGIPNANAG